MTNLDDERQSEHDPDERARPADPPHPDPNASALPQPPSDQGQTPAPPFEALFPRLDQISPSTFRRGSLSRRRVNIAALVLVAIGVATVALIVLGGALFGPK